jgi:chemotaxis protein MotB
MAEGIVGKPNIQVRVVKKHLHGHHGGAWKVAYADFVTAMMAFFLLLWLLNAVTEEQLHGVADYFAPMSASLATKGSGKISGGGYAEPAVVQMPIPQITYSPDNPDETQPADEPIDEASFNKLMAKKEEAQFKKAAGALQQTIDSNPDLAQLKDHLLVDMTAEGLRIQLIDANGVGMFPSGTANMQQFTRDLLTVVGGLHKQMPQKVSVTGHTDAVPFRNAEGNYSNWELSSDRALASRRVLKQAGVPDERIAKVVGKAATEPLVKEAPTHESNRRISIILLREHDLKTADEAQPLKR